MKAVATALVLIVGAAVVLWYGNTLNSWVLGGLIGGFGALLLSIPISLVLFSYFSCHYDEHLEEEVLEHEKISLAQHGSYSIVQDQSAYNEEYFDYEDQEFYSEYDEEEIYEGELDVDKDEYLHPEQSVWEEEQPRYIPPARYLSPPSTRLSATNNVDPEQQLVRRKKTRPRPVPGYQTPSSHSRYRWEALHAARMEAALQAEHVVDSLPPQNSSRRPLSAPDDASQTDRFARHRDTQTEYGMDEAAPDSVRRPLIRRAPYMYDDDPLREEMAQYAKRPIVRRSSRYLNPPSADDAR